MGRNQWISRMENLQWRLLMFFSHLSCFRCGSSERKYLGTTVVVIDYPFAFLASTSFPLYHSFSILQQNFCSSFHLSLSPQQTSAKEGMKVIIRVRSDQKGCQEIDRERATWEGRMYLISTFEAFDSHLTVIFTSDIDFKNKERQEKTLSLFSHLVLYLNHP